MSAVPIRDSTDNRTPASDYDGARSTAATGGDSMINDGRNNNDYIGAFRVGNDDESIDMFSMLTRDSSARVVKATAIDATLAPSTDDVEAIVEQRIREQIGVAQRAEVTTTRTEGRESMFEIKKKHMHKTICFVLFVVIIAAAILVAIFVPNPKEEENNNNANDEVVEATVAPTTAIIEGSTTLEQIRNRGFLRCGADEFKIGFSFHSPANDSVDGFLNDYVSLHRNYCKVLLPVCYLSRYQVDLFFKTITRY